MIHEVEVPVLAALAGEERAASVVVDDEDGEVESVPTGTDTDSRECRPVGGVRKSEVRQVAAALRAPVVERQDGQVEGAELP